jgi:hypothetical protein
MVERIREKRKREKETDTEIQKRDKAPSILMLSEGRRTLSGFGDGIWGI